MSKYADDENKMKRIREGDEALLKELFQQYWHSFYPLHYKKINLNRELVLREIYAATFAKWYDNIIEYKIKEPLKSALETYFNGIGKNYVYKYFDKLERYKEDFKGDLETFQKKHQLPEIEEIYEARVKANLIQKLLDHLKGDCRELIELSFLKEEKDAFILQKMKHLKSLVNIRQKRFSCLEKLRKLYRNK